MKTVLETVNAALVAVMDDHSGESTGVPTYSGAGYDFLVDGDDGLAGRVPANVEWTTDRGNWMWDGVLVALRAMGVDPSLPLGPDTGWEPHFRLYVDGRLAPHDDDGEDAPPDLPTAQRLLTSLLVGRDPGTTGHVVDAGGTTVTRYRVDEHGVPRTHA